MCRINIDQLTVTGLSVLAFVPSGMLCAVVGMLQVRPTGAYCAAYGYMLCIRYTHSEDIVFS